MGSMAFGNPTRYIQLDPAKIKNIPAVTTAATAPDKANSRPVNTAATRVLEISFVVVVVVLFRCFLCPLTNLSHMHIFRHVAATCRRRG